VIADNYAFRVDFKDRMVSQKQIKLFLEDIFTKVGKSKINLDDFIQVNQSYTSEMFLSVTPWHLISLDYDIVT
jgi:hypothetical protein